MIVMRSRKLAERIKHYDSLRKDKSKLKGFTARRDDLNKLLTDLTTAIERATLLAQNGIMPFDLLPTTDVQVASVKAVQDQFKKMPESILTPKALNDLHETINQLITILNDNAQKSWLDYARNNVPKPNAELLRILSQIPGIKTTANQIIKLYKDLEPFQTSPPNSNEQLQDFRNKTRSLSDLWKSIGSDAIPSKVVGFLKAAVADGANLDLLDEDVRKWISNNNLKNVFRIKVFG